MFQLKKTIYENMPGFLRKLVRLVPYSLLAGKEYRDTLALCRQFDRMSREEVLAVQEKELRELLEFATKEVPFYQTYRSAVERFTAFEALKEFPLLTKEDVQTHYEELIPRSIGRIPHHIATTGGSSGQQLKFLEDDATYAREMGYMHSQWQRVGYSHNCRKPTFRGVAFGKNNGDVFWQENPINNELQFSPFHLSEKNLPRYVDKIKLSRPQFIHGYPSAVDVLAEFVLRHDLVGLLGSVQAVLLGSEGCSDLQRERIERAFGTKIYTWYGHSERVILGGECEKNKWYHCFPGYGFLEIIKPDGSFCDMDERGEIVGTGFLNRSMPLIRYRTDDFAARREPSCECGRQWDRFSDVIGRRSIEGFVIGKSGARISAVALNMHSLVFDNVIRYQYYQKVKGTLEIRVIANPHYSKEDEKKIVDEHNKKMWQEMDIKVVQIDTIPLTRVGKQLRIVCEIDTDKPEG
jgi:phenylacetate-CoA ligase